MARIIRKKMTVNNPYDLRVVYVVDGVYIFPTRKKAEAFINKTKKRATASAIRNKTYNPKRCNK